MTAVMTEAPKIEQTAQLQPTNGATYDRFRLGWRMAQRVQPNGRVVWERIPLTMQDILHPQEEDFRVHTHEHKQYCVYLNDVIEAQVADDPTAVVLHDTRVDWRHPDIEPHGPDVALIFGVREVKRWGTFDVIQEGTRPILIIEITSPETRHLDLEDKRDEYEQVGVEYYVIVDTHTTKRRPNYELIGYRLTPEGYVRMPTNEKNWLWLPPVRIWVGLVNNTLVCFDAQGKRIGKYAEIKEAQIIAEVRAEQAEERAEKAEIEVELSKAKAKELEERLKAQEEELQRLRAASTRQD